MKHQKSILVETLPRMMTEITSEIAHIVATSGVPSGLVNVFVRHTSCSLTITEKADADIRGDLETLAKRWAPDGDPAYRRDTEGEDDMASLARSVLTGVSLNIPCANGRLLLGRLQGIYLWEHRAQAHQREIVVSVLG